MLLLPAPWMSTIDKPRLDLAGPKQLSLLDGVVPKVFSKEGLHPGAAGFRSCDSSSLKSHTLLSKRLEA
eukprot:11570990-Karenia_brevis.AAC.1